MRTDFSETIISKSTNNPLFNAAQFPADSYCEAFVPAGQPRIHWAKLLATLDAKGAEGLTRQHVRARRMRHEDGATINPFDDPAERSTSWDLDLIPLQISSAEWREIESGLLQRAMLLEGILADTYGPQRLLKSGHIPPELVFANPNFLHCCHNIPPLANRYLTFYTVDLYRAPDGKFRVIRDYASNPSGLGYALENRIVMSRVLANLYHKTQILRLAPFFQSFQRALMRRASLGKKDPGIVLLSSGPDGHVYFEHALLSRYLGYPLVEAQDLTVRNGKVFLKKLAGLEPVEAIFRHISDQAIDPFALRRETSNGVAGLVQVCREQNVVVVNPIGSGFINTPALPVFLPELCRHLLGEELSLQNHPSWWCGNPEGLEYGMSNFEELTVGSALNRYGKKDASQSQIALLKDAPAACMVSEPVRPASVPGWRLNGACSCYSLLRLFVCATETGFAVMPGGLAVTAPDVETLTGDFPARQQSKDIWVISERPVESITLMEGFHAIDEFKRSSDLPSRVADHLLWLGRYLERSEGLLRLLRSTFRRLLGEDRPQDIPELPFLLNLLRAKNIIPVPKQNSPDIPLFHELYSHLNDGLYQKERVDSVVAILKLVQNAARKVRDRLSVDSSRIINRLEDLTDYPSTDPMEFMDETLFTLNGFSGLAMESMTRSLGWRFMDMGRRIERAINQTDLITSALPQVCNESRDTLDALLEVSDSTMTYRARYRSTFQLAPVLDLLLVDETNPKSLAFQLNHIAAHVENLPRQTERHFAYAEERIALKMLTATRLLDLTDIHCDPKNAQSRKLSVFLNSMTDDLKEFSLQVTGHYLTRVPATPHFTVLPAERRI